MNKRNGAVLAFLASLTLPNFALAQIVYQPVAGGGGGIVAVPTLTTAALLLSIVLLLAVAKWAGFDRRSVGKVVGVLAVAAVTSGALSVKVISDARADGGGGTNFGVLSSASGGSAPINDGVLNFFENTSGVDQRIESITLGACPNVARGLIEGLPQCEEGAVVATDVDGMCYTDCRSAPG